MIVKVNIAVRKFRSLLLKIFHYLENNDNVDFNKNGERSLLRDLVRWYSGEGSVTIFDVGAHVGTYTDIVLSEFSGSQTNVNAHVFEPTHSSFAVLKEKFGSNGSITLNDKAVSDGTGTSLVYYDEERSGFTSIYQRNLKAYGVTLDKSEQVETLRLDEYIKQHSISHIHFVKIDIEGHELAAMRGLGSYLNADFIDFIQFEYGGANLDSHSSLLELYTLLETHGFHIAKVKRNGLELRRYLPWMDNFHYANYVAISKHILNRLS